MTHIDRLDDLTAAFELLSMTLNDMTNDNVLVEFVIYVDPPIPVDPDSSCGIMPEQCIDDIEKDMGNG